MIDRGFVGLRSAPRIVEIERGQLRFFAKATGETDPIYSDEAAARSAGHPTLPAPPTFVFGLAQSNPATSGDLLRDMSIDPRCILHGEQSFRYHAPVYAGDRLTLVTETVDIYEKKGGALEFVVQRTSAINQNGALCLVMDVTTAVRHAEF